MMSKIKSREEIDSRYKWKLEDIYPDEEAWEEDYQFVQNKMQAIAELQGTLGQSAQKLLEALRMLDEIGQKQEKTYVYSKMRRDENNADPKYQNLFQRAENLAVQLGSAVSFIVPEITGIPSEKLAAFIDENKDLQLYRHYLDEIMRQKEHILSAAEERILAMTADLSMASGNIFSLFNNADIKFPVIKDEQGQEVEITKGRYGRFMESTDRRVRKEAFEGLFDTYGKFKNTLAATLNSSIKSDVFYARVRKYPSSLHASLDQDNISPDVYHRLIETVHNNLKYMYQYVALRKRLLGVDELHMYDLYVPMVKDAAMDIPYEKARELVIEGLKPLGEEYVAKLAEGLDSGWVDVYENEGKTSGAYSWGTYGTHPYVLLNYDNKLDDVFTLAHEMGHSMHTYYSNLCQPYVYSKYPIFLAEVASTVNEALLIDYLLDKTKDKKEKMYLLNHYLEQFRGTVFRQTMFAEFEKVVREKAERGVPLNSESFSKIYQDLNRLYYGPEMVIDPQIAIEWARIPHFYSGFYVYKYATGFSAAIALKQQLAKGDQSAVNRYMQFLNQIGKGYRIPDIHVFN
jgi:oligoendopeptidase F